MPAWEGTASELLGELATRMPEERRHDGWPSNSAALSGRLRADQASYAKPGIALSFRGGAP